MTPHARRLMVGQLLLIATVLVGFANVATGWQSGWLLAAAVVFAAVTVAVVLWLLAVRGREP